MQDTGIVWRLHGQPCSQGSIHSLTVLGDAGKKYNWLGFKSEGSWSPYKEAGTRMEEGPRVTALPCAMSWGRGPGSALQPPRNGSGKLGHSSAPQHPTAALEKALALSPFMAWRSYRTVAAPVANGKQNCRELGIWPSHSTPSYELKYSNYWRQDFHGNAAFLLYRAAMHTKGYLQGMCSKIACLFHNSSEEWRGYLYLVPGWKKELHFMHKDTVQAWQYKKSIINC